MRTLLSPVACHGEPMAGFPKGRRIPLGEGGDNVSPENSSGQVTESRLAASLLVKYFNKGGWS